MTKLHRLPVLACLIGASLCAHAETLRLRLHGSNTLGARLAPALLEAHARLQRDRFESSTELERHVAGDPGALGFVGVSHVASAKALSRALRDIERLSEFMGLPQNRGREVRLAAFSHAHGQTPVIALMTLNDRVDHLSQLLALRGVALGSSRGFVDPSPVAGAGEDERVEVWIGEPARDYSGDRPL